MGKVITLNPENTLDDIRKTAIQKKVGREPYLNNNKRGHYRLNLTEQLIHNVHHDFAIQEQNIVAWENGYSLSHSKIIDLTLSATTHSLISPYQFGQTLGVRWITPILNSSSMALMQDFTENYRTSYSIRWNFKNGQTHRQTEKKVFFSSKQIKSAPLTSQPFSRESHSGDNGLKNSNFFIEMTDAETDHVLWRSLNLTEENANQAAVKHHTSTFNHHTSTFNHHASTFNHGFSTDNHSVSAFNELSTSSNNSDRTVDKFFAVDENGSLWRWDINPTPSSEIDFAKGGIIAVLTSPEDMPSLKKYIAPEIALLNPENQSTFLAVAAASIQKENNNIIVDVYVIRDPFPFTAPSSYNYIKEKNLPSRTILNQDLKKTYNRPALSKTENPDCRTESPSDELIWGYHLTHSFTLNAYLQHSAHHLSNLMMINSQLFIGVHWKTAESSQNTHLISIDLSHWQIPTCVTHQKWKWPNPSVYLKDDLPLYWSINNSHDQPLSEVCLGGVCRSDIIDHQLSSNPTHPLQFNNRYGKAYIYYLGTDHPPIVEHLEAISPEKIPNFNRFGYK